MTPEQRRHLVRDVATTFVNAALYNAIVKVGDSGVANLLLDRPEAGPLTDAEFATLACDIRNAAKRATITVEIPDSALGGDA